MSDTLITAQELRDKNPSGLPELTQNLSKSSFWYYTRLSTADTVLNQASFRVSNLKDMNDLDEVQLHADNQDNLFALCFCNSNTEKIPMWYLYSGIAGNGAALGFTPLRMSMFIRSIRTVKGVIGKEPVADLAIGSDVELQYGWVYYRKESKPEEVLYQNKWYVIDDSQLFEKDNYFLKAYPWEYEREFRIIFINQTNAKYDALFVDIPEEILKNIKVKLAPELSKDKFLQIKNLSCIGKDSRFEPQYSKLSIKMNLFHRNRKSLPDYLKTEFSKDAPDITPSELCELIHSAGKCIHDNTI